MLKRATLSQIGARMLPTAQQFSRRSLRFVILAACLLVVGAVVVWFFLNSSTPTVAPPQPASSDPRVTYAGPFRNVHPDATTVGSERCAKCHPDVARVYANHPMGRSVLPIAGQRIGDMGEKGHVSFSALGSRFQIDRAGDRLWYTETRTGAGGEVLYELTGQVNYVIGSGTKGHSFLTQHDGFVTQDAISWFTQKHLWDESPGFSPELHAGRLIQASCLYCHANEVVPVPGTTNKYDLPLFRNGHAIGCERCHGPGSVHVELREAGGSLEHPDYSIVNPKHLDAPLREAVCQLCHLAGEVRVSREGRTLSDFRPGLPLDAVMRVLVFNHRGEDRKAVNHVEQMYLSKCYIASGGKLGCITCHNPHEKAPIEKRMEQYRAACLQCHDCTSPVAARAQLGSPDNCISCHMPQFAAKDIVHAASTNHRIVRTRETLKAGSSQQPGARGVLFFPDRPANFQNPTEARDYAVGLVEMTKFGKVHPGEGVREALPLLEHAIAESPGDARAWEAKSYALQLAGRKSEALGATQTLLSLVPNHEIGLTRAATLAYEFNQLPQSLSYWQKAVAVNPRNAGYRQELALVLAGSDKWEEAGVEARESLRLDPALATAQTILAIAAVRTGNAARGDELFRIVEQLKPVNLGQLREWYRTKRIRP